MGRQANRCVGDAVGLSLAIAGVGITAAGLWARLEAARTLARERIVVGDSSTRSRCLRTPGAARSLAETIRRTTVEAAGGRTYSETDEYLARDGTTTADASLAVADDRTGKPVRNPDADLWIRSTTLQTALTQAYLAFRIAELTTAVGLAFVAAGLGIRAAARG